MRAPYRIFLCPYSFDKKSTIFSIYKGYKKSYRELHNFFASISPFPMKNPVLEKTQKMTKKRVIFVISFFHQPYFSLRNFHDFRKKTLKKVSFFDHRPHDVTISVFFFAFLVSFQQEPFQRPDFLQGKTTFFSTFVRF